MQRVHKKTLEEEDIMFKDSKYCFRRWMWPYNDWHFVPQRTKHTCILAFEFKFEFEFEIVYTYLILTATKSVGIFSVLGSPSPPNHLEEHTIFPSKRT